MVINKQKNILDTTIQLAPNGSYIIHTMQSDLSTINKDADNYASNYDHFTFDEHTRSSVVQGTPHRINAVEGVGDYKTYKEKISDHIPIMLEIDL